MSLARAGRLAFFAFVVGITSASARAGDGPAGCNRWTFQPQRTDFALYRVASEWAGIFLCPDAPLCRSRFKAHRGDIVLATASHAGYLCATADGHTGWIAVRHLERLASLQSPRPSLRAWVGFWGDRDLNITIARRGSALHATGAAYWPGKDYVPPPGRGPMQHFGSFKATAVPDGDRIVFEDHECRVDARLVGPLLVVADNQRCGGLNVTFTDVLGRAGRK